MVVSEYQNPVCVRLGSGARRQVAGVLSTAGRCLVVTSAGNRRRPAVAEILDSLRDRDPVVIDEVESNPSLAGLEAVLARLAHLGIQSVVAIGGGSVIDTAKVIAVGLSGADFSLRRHLLDGAPLPARRTVALACLPTTAGTGSEVTPFATVWDYATRKKHSVAGPAVFPDYALADAELTLSLPRDLTVMTGLDALTQACEAIWSRRANPVSTAVATRAIRLALAALPGVEAGGGALAWREAMMEASLLAGLAISSARTALCHSMSYPLTMHLGIPHGLACGFTLPEVYAFNAAIDPARFDALARDVGCVDRSALQHRLEELMATLGVRDLLRAFHAEEEVMLRLVPEMLSPGRADNNLRTAGLTEVAGLLRAACRGRGL